MIELWVRACETGPGHEGKEALFKFGIAGKQGFRLKIKSDYGNMTIGGIAMEHYMQAGKFKAECLKVMEIVMATGDPVIITKHRIPIAKLCPIEQKEISLFGKMRGTVHVKGDLIKPIDEEWDAAR
jgi:prevent-host-death family protein